MILRFFAIVAVLLSLPYILPGIKIEGLYTAIIITILWSLANVTVKPVLLFITLPIQFLTLGLASFLVNGFIFWFLATFIKGFEVSGFLTATLGALVLSLTNALLHKFE